ncbi:UBX domain-containing protein 1 isoform X1 [Cricetulus griseus]|uniref:UBX domain-containing protein 1 n=1 Tax=Cricetulus griseus TaxID=10029 RepID=G3I059_CRIGR|nr:UBX domain-containing protein 1 isoform X1 [Cricetulus griseus]EGV92751.1 UBX domain-containing protein 1 [Cricetulus griseus]
MAELTALESLIEMGFPRGRAEKALALTGNQGIEAAMDWLMEHEDDPDVDEPLETPLGHILGREPTSSEQVGPEGSGSAAEESKPILTEEERQEQTKSSVGSQSSPPATDPGPVPSSPSQEPPTKREYDQCRIQVRLPDGTSLTQTFRAREQLAAVRLYVELHRGEEPGQDQDPVQLLSGFPRRAFSEADMERPLQELGLVPSAVLIVAKKCPS